MELAMKPATKLMTGRLLLTLVALMTIVSPFLADWNATHIYNPLWPPHAKFHNAQTMSLAVLLGLSALGFLWRKHPRLPDAIAAVLFASLYWLSQLPAFLFPGVAWTDPNLLGPGQSLTDIPIQIKGDVVIFAVVGLALWLLVSAIRGGLERAAEVPSQIFGSRVETDPLGADAHARAD